MIKIKGMAHVIINVSNWDTCIHFYRKLMPFLGMEQVFAGKDMIYFVGGRTALGINRLPGDMNNQRFDQTKVGLHHLCFRASSRGDIDTLFDYLKTIDSNIIHPPENGAWAPGYYSVLFEDPVGTRLELNYVPGKGVLAKGVSFNPSVDYK